MSNQVSKLKTKPETNGALPSLEDDLPVAPSEEPQLDLPEGVERPPGLPVDVFIGVYGTGKRTAMEDHLKSIVAQHQSFMLELGRLCIQATEMTRARDSANRKLQDIATQCALIYEKVSILEQESVTIGNYLQGLEAGRQLAIDSGKKMP